LASSRHDLAWTRRSASSNADHSTDAAPDDVLVSDDDLAGRGRFGLLVFSTL